MVIECLLSLQRELRELGDGQAAGVVSQTVLYRLSATDSGPQ